MISWWWIPISIGILLIISIPLLILTRIGAVINAIQAYYQSLSDLCPSIYWMIDYNHLETELKSLKDIESGEVISYEVYPIIVNNNNFKTALENLSNSQGYLVTYEIDDLKLTATIYFTKL